MFFNPLYLFLTLATLSRALPTDEPEPIGVSPQFPDITSVPEFPGSNDGWIPFDPKDLETIIPSDIKLPESNLRATDYKCDTTSGSPKVQDLAKASAELLNRNKFDKCFQDNPGGSHCTNLASRGTAAIGICGGHGAWVICREAGDLGAFIIEKCKWNNLAGGQIRFINGSRLIYYHS